MISKILNKDKKENTNKQSKQTSIEVEIVFGHTEEINASGINDEFPKKLLSLKDKENVSYALFAKKQTKLKAKEIIALAILDIIKNDHENGIMLLDEKTYLFVSKDKEKEFVYHIKTIPIDEVETKGEVDNFAEGYFRGYPYYLCDEPSVIKKTHLNNNENTIRLILLFVIVVIGAGIFIAQSSLFQDAKKIKPLKPYVQLPSKIEVWHKKRNINIKIFDGIIKKVKDISYSNEANRNVYSTRISAFSFSAFQNIAPEQPYYDEQSNSWIYANENKKRGGVSLQTETSIEKRYADVGYKAKDENIYLTEEKNATESLYPVIPTEEGEHNNSVTIDCISAILSISRTSQRESDNIVFELNDKKMKKYNNFTIVLAVRKILDECPIYMESFSISDSSTAGKIYLYFDGKEK